VDNSETGDLNARAADEKWLAVVYEELRTLAAARLARESPGQTLQPTALVHEAYLRLLSPSGEPVNWEHSGHFFAAAAEAMRRTLIDRARQRKRLKRGGEFGRIDFSPELEPCSKENDQVIEVDEALARLAAEYPEHARLVQLRYFAGLTIDQAADVLSISRSTAKRYWTFARAWLLDDLRSGR
jgi:RNA polymerase sigma factor (TIGR02999 family)